MNFIGIDLGATKIKAGIISEDGRIIDKTTANTPIGDGIDTIKYMAKIYKSYKNSASEPGE